MYLSNPPGVFDFLISSFMMQTRTMPKIGNKEPEIGALVKEEAVGNTIGNLATTIKEYVKITSIGSIILIILGYHSSRFSDLTIHQRPRVQGTQTSYMWTF